MKPRAKRKNSMKTKSHVAPKSDVGGSRSVSRAAAHATPVLHSNPIAKDGRSTLNALPRQNERAAGPRSTLHAPRYAIRKHIAFWSLTFDGQEACFDHEQGACYVAYLLLNQAYEWLKKNRNEITDAAQRSVRAVRQAIHHFHEALAESVDAKGMPHPVLRDFAEYIQKTLLIPSARYFPPLANSQPRIAGCFTYEPPSGIKWSA